MDKCHTMNLTETQNQLLVLSLFFNGFKHLECI